MPVETSQQVEFEIPDEPVFQMGSLGKGLRLTRRKAVNLDQEFATEMLNMPEFAGDRALNEDHVIFLTRQIEGGLFRWEQVSIITCKCGGREYRMNGQHTCWARLEVAKNHAIERTLQNCPVQHLTYEADSDQDMRQLYATIDRNKARTNGNVVISYLAGRAEFIKYNKRVIKALAEGLAFWQWENHTKRSLHVADERAFLMLRNYYKLTCRVGDFMNNSKPNDFRHMSRRPVISAMFATFDRAPEIASEFWETIRDGLNLTNKNDPRSKLRHLLLTSTIAAGGEMRSNDATTLSSEEMFRYCIQAWNAFRESRELKVFKVPLDKPRSAVRS